MFPIIQIGPLSLQTPGLIIILGLWFGLNLAERNSHRFNISPDILYNIVFTSLAAGVVGARIIYVIRNFDAFLNSPLNIFSLNPGLLDLSGGISIGFLAAIIFGNRRHVPFWGFLDAITPLLAVSAIAFYLSQFASGDAFGIETSLPWGIRLWGAKRHPTQIYNLLFTILTLGFIRHYQIKRESSNNPGTTFLLFMAFSAGGRLILDAFRGDSVTLIYQIRITQVVAWCLLAISIWQIQRSTKTRNKMERSMGNGQIWN
jgi:prolipoprotein diacylglyceryltransferase